MICNRKGTHLTVLPEKEWLSANTMQEGTRLFGTERPPYRGTEDAAQRISDLEREIKQREQSREYSSIKERLEAGRQSIADREREVAKRKRHDRGMSR